jgi:hypothetical protein
MDTNDIKQENQTKRVIEQQHASTSNHEGSKTIQTAMSTKSAH